MSCFFAGELVGVAVGLGEFEGDFGGHGAGHLAGTGGEELAVFGEGWQRISRRHCCPRTALGRPEGSIPLCLIGRKVRNTSGMGSRDVRVSPGVG